MNGEIKEEKSSNKKWILLTLIVIIVLGIFVYLSTFPSKVSFDASVASVFGGIKSETKTSILIVGDIMLDRNVRNTINKNGFDPFFEGVKDLLSKPDITIGNLEGPITIYPSVTTNLKNKELKFTFDPKVTPKLKEVGFDVLGLANNHTLNFGKIGFQMTKDYIKEAGMVYYGDPNNKEEISTIIEKNGIKIGLVGFHEFSYVNYEKVLIEIDRLRPLVDILIVTPHWGPEYKKEPNQKMTEMAHEFIDHGVDVVFGTHPHVVAHIEEYKGKKIYYSLGNFVFDQYFSRDTSNGLAVRMDVVKNKVKVLSIDYTDIPISIDRSGVRIASSTASY